MGIFAIRARRTPMADPGARGELPDSVRMGLPHRFEAVAEVIASGSDPVGPCEVAGRELARDGASLEEALEGLRTTWQAVRGCDPAYGAVKALLGAWSDTTLSYLHEISCEDPMTGLASLAHLRSRLAEVHRHPVGNAAERHALVVCELVDDGGSSLGRAMHLARLGEAARTVFPGTETIGRVGARRVVVVADRDERLAARVRLLRTLVETDRRRSRVWIEGLSEGEAGSAALLDELARD